MPTDEKKPEKKPAKRSKPSTEGSGDENAPKKRKSPAKKQKTNVAEANVALQKAIGTQLFSTLTNEELEKLVDLKSKYEIYKELYGSGFVEYVNKY